MLVTPNVAASELMLRLADARRRTDDLFRIVRPNFFYERPIPERHRIVFYLGHLEAFDWNLLHERIFGLNSVHPEFDRLFAFGIDPVGGGLPSDQPSDWPDIGQVQGYVADIRAALDVKIADGIVDHSLRTSDGHPLHTLLNAAIEHRLMHAETLAYMLHQLPFEQKIKQESFPVTAPEPVVPQMIAIPAGDATLGLSRRAEEFGWDNEYEAHVVSVPAFAIDKHKVTNAEFLNFVSQGGYENRAFWSESGWDWKTEEGISHPVFWKHEGDRWLYRTMFEEVRLPASWPVYVSHAEAEAFARWAGKSLPTEAEWHRAAYGTPEGFERAYPWGNEVPSVRPGNFDSVHWEPTPVNAFPEGAGAFGVEDLAGNGWEWTATLFGPFPGFEPFSFYRGYSADFFDGKHFVMKGGSPRTAACMLRRSFRNWFQPHYQYVYAGFRCVERSLQISR